MKPLLSIFRMQYKNNLAKSDNLLCYSINKLAKNYEKLVKIYSNVINGIKGPNHIFHEELKCLFDIF